LLAPAGTPPSIINRLNGKVRKAMGSAEMKERLASVGIKTRLSTPEQFAMFINAETVRFAKVIRAVGIKAE